MTVFKYDNRMRKAMSDFKFNGYCDYADYFVYECIESCRERIELFKPQVIVPVPVHRTRRAYRGYNQAELLAKGIAKRLGVPCVNDFLIRPRKTEYQKKLGAKNRKTNTQNAFSCNFYRYNIEEIQSSFNRVLIVDDIYTTGSTLNECSLALIKGGVAHVAVLSICMGQGY